MSETTQTTQSQSLVTKISAIATNLLLNGIESVQTNRFAQVGCAIGGILAIRGMFHHHNFIFACGIITQLQL